MKASPANKKTFAFKIVAILFPFILLFLVEVGLRWAGYGSSFPLFTKVEGRPGYVVMNPNISQKYFFASQNATSGYQEQFKKNKDPNTFRIFILGASTGVGYPYLKNGSFHRWLQYGLTETFPKQQFELINLSLTAVNSYTLLDFTDAVVNYKPDAVLIYAGHNEYYGALGVGAANSLGKYPRVVNLMLQLRSLRIVQLASHAFNNMKTLFSGDAEKPETLMKRMAANQSIPLGSDTYQDGIDQFRFNMNAMLSRLNEQNIPTFISSVVSNQKDVPPFISDSSSSETSALYHYQKAQQAYEAGRHDDAKKGFMRAKELDMLRFRAPEAINKTIRTLSNDFPAAYLVETQQRFNDASPHRIPGNELLSEHVHPNLQGYSLIAHTFYQSLEKHKPFNLLWENPLELSTLRKEMPITIVDSLQGSYEVKMLKQGWPYYDKNSGFDKPTNTPEEIAGQLVLQNISWDTAMNRLYQYYRQNDAPREALKVLQAFNLEHPEHTQSYIQSAELALQLNEFSKAERFLAKAFQLQKSTNTARQFAIKLIRAGQFKPALPYLDFINAQDPGDYVSQRLRKSITSILSISDPVNSEAQKINKMLQQAKVYLTVGQNNKAADLIDKVLNIDPSNVEAKELLQQLNS